MRRISGEAFLWTWQQRRTRRDKAYFQRGIFADIAAWLEIAVYKKAALPTELLCSKHNYKQLILPLKMANRFIPYVPKPTNKKHSSKLPCKSVPKQPSIVDSNQQIKGNSVLIRAPAVESNLLMQKVNRYNGIMARGIHIYPILLRLILM
jgi:hypothetical protein